MDVDDYMKRNGKVFWGDSPFYEGMDLEYEESVNGGSYKYPIIGQQHNMRSKSVPLETGDEGNIPAEINPKFYGELIGESRYL